LFPPIPPPQTPPPSTPFLDGSTDHFANKELSLWGGGKIGGNDLGVRKSHRISRLPVPLPVTVWLVEQPALRADRYVSFWLA